ncbi:MAG: monofunctional biosynthetic peptidoglycan transglycosylase [Sulfurimonas sp.]|jgi:monofunctional biosynthetic peptidoglycan transglycosylase
MNKFFKFTLIILALGAVDIGRYFLYPDVDALKETNPIPTAFMEFRKEQWADENRKIKMNHTWVKIGNISTNIIKAVLIAEDDGFYNHDGFDIKGMENAIERSIKKGTLAGGSTISQQLSKNLYLSPSKNPIRKIKEAIITYRIEKTLSKRRILEIYLNIAEWGDGIFGIEAASRHHYGKSAKNLTALEASRLASVLPNPIRYNPNGNQKYVKNRVNVIYKTMEKRGAIQSVYQEVMTPKKEDEAVVAEPMEENSSIEPEVESVKLQNNGEQATDLVDNNLTN